MHDQETNLWRSKMGKDYQNIYESLLFFFKMRNYVKFEFKNWISLKSDTMN